MSEVSLTSLDRPWLEHYPPGRPAEIESFHHQNLADYLQAVFVEYADEPSYTNFGTTLTFRQVSERAHAFAAYLQHELGYKKGDRIALMMPNLLQYPVCFYGCQLAGLVVVNVNPLYTARELEHQLHDAQVKGIVIAENFAHTLADARNQLPEIEDIIVTKFGDELGFFKGMALNFAIRYIKKLVPNYYLAGALNYSDVVSKGKSLELKRVEMTLDDVAMLQYTGGTTGVAKGAMLTHKNILANVEQVNLWVGEEVKESGLIMITALPLYHIFCCTVNCLLFPSKGMHSVLVTNPRDMKSFVKLLAKYPPAVTTGVNTLFKGLLNTDGFDRLDFSDLKFVISGGMPLEKVVSEEWQAVTGNVIIEGYGLTETSPIVCVNWLYADGFTNGIGYPMPSTEVMLCDEDGEVVGVDTPGEMWVRGPQVMKGYWNQPEENKTAITEEGWFKTGDMAQMDETGFFKIVDRKKDMILVSGFNVYPTEVEGVIMEHPAVLEVGCIGVPSEESGEVVKAYIVLKKGKKVSEEELRKFAKENLTGYKRPKFYQFCDELPKSNVGKILRRKLPELDPQDND
ncbi:AMP-binding protein [Suttonella sp. R2A3]|uniref:AMP-binding protein n=1 Tax=Suttonella sp. R2A3 TaxID=2908648 RepID=UPI001F269281|nr:AMP-binding protein [Suttonella sp. R2A3]UJF24978.1 AMP-binding protein [Suttonella sp. R2A3]